VGSTLFYSSRLPNDTAEASLAVDAAGTLHFAGYGGLVSTLSPAQPPGPRIFGIANAAFGPAGGRMVGGELISIYGPHIGPAAPVAGVPDASGTMRVSLGGVQVFVNGSPVPLLYVSDSQVNAVTPLNLPVATERVHVSFNSSDTADFAATVMGAIPEVFQRGDGTAAAINQDGSVNSADNPAPPGSVVAVWVTGIGATPYGFWQDGYLAGGPTDFWCCQVYVDGYPAEMLYGGAAPGVVAGVAQVNFRWPVAGLSLSYAPEVIVSVSAHGVTAHGDPNTDLTAVLGLCAAADLAAQAGTDGTAWRDAARGVMTISGRWSAWNCARCIALTSASRKKACISAHRSRNRLP